ncbi:response regulator [Paenibacillus sp. OV219]|uniref:response regulator transcription factor n=1 Tax=Paenibacillus sp. OV219 TaxID=1884377 RepID=UPI0008D7B66D|nr:response regulator [Paenibacillus sp. OV219]SEN81212.1 Helix-turn-helix domain-containing protein [Paenibacillus sp. OV219]
MYNLMIVDDEVEIRTGLKNYFPWNEIGYEVVCEAENGLQALELLKEKQVDVILSDIMMPLMSGLELAKELHENDSAIKLVFLSGYMDFQYAKQAMTYSVKNYLVKPTVYKELVEVFQSLKAELDKERSKSEQRAEEADSKQENRYISAIKKFIDANYTNVTLESASAHVHLNHSYTSKLFRQQTGITFMDYVIQVKMQKAAELLANPIYKTYEISEMLGYTNPHNFTRSFKRVFGKSPRDYRNHV